MRRKSFYTKVFLTFSIIVAVTVIGAGLGFMRVLRLTITDYEIRYSKQITGELTRNLDATIEQVQAMIGALVRRLSGETSAFRRLLATPRADSVASDRAALVGFDAFFHGKLADIPAISAITVFASAPDEFHVFNGQPGFRVDTGALSESEEFQWVQSRPDYFEAVRSSRPVEPDHLTLVTSLIDTELNHYGVLAVHVDLRAALKLTDSGDRVGRIVVIGDDGHIYLATPAGGPNESPDLLDAVTVDPDRTPLETNGYVAVVKQSRRAMLNVANLIPTSEMYAEVRRSRVVAGVLVIVLLGISVATVSYLSGHIASRVHRIGLGMQRLQAGEWGVQIPEGWDSGELSGLEASFNEMSRVVRELIHREYISEMNMKQAQLAALQNQIRPHFLFNTLESIRLRLLNAGHAEAARPLMLLSDLFSAVVRERSLLIPLEREIEYCESYLELYALRYPDRLSTGIDADESLYDLYVPKLILQPLLENAIRHGLEQTEGAVEIRLVAAVRDGMLELVVIDDGPGIKAETLAEITRRIERSNVAANKIGLANVHHRVRAMFGEPYGLSIESRNGTGTRVRVTCPPIEHDELESHVHSRNR